MCMKATATKAQSPMLSHWHIYSPQVRPSSSCDGLPPASYRSSTDSACSPLSTLHLPRTIAPHNLQPWHGPYVSGRNCHYTLLLSFLNGIDLLLSLIATSHTHDICLIQNANLLISEATSFTAASNASFTTTVSNSLAKLISYSAFASLLDIVSGVSVPRPRSRDSSAPRLGGITKMERASSPNLFFYIDGAFNVYIHYQVMSDSVTLLTSLSSVP